MCRNIRPLYNFEPPATHDEVHDAALQFVRKVSGFTKPAKANEEAFELRRAGDLGRDDAPARLARDERAAQGPRGRGGQAPRPLGRALRRVAPRSPSTRGPAGIRQGPSRLLACHGRGPGPASLGGLRRGDRRDVGARRRVRPRLGGRRPRSADVPRRLRLAPGHAARPRVRHARGPRADGARQRPGRQPPQRDAGHLRPRPVRPGLRLARGACRATTSASPRPPGSRSTTTTSRPAPAATRCG